MLLSARSCLIALGLLTTVALCYPSALAAREAPTKATFTRDEAQKDLRHLVRLLRRVHPNLHTHRSPKELKRRFNAIIEEVRQGEDRWGLLTKTQKILASVCDEHTGVNLFGELNILHGQTGNWFAEPVIATKDALLLERGEAGGGPVAISSINGRDADRLRQLLLDLVQTDGCIQGDITMPRHHPGLMLYLTDALRGLSSEFPINVKSTGNALPQISMTRARTYRWATSLSHEHTKPGRQVPLSKLGITTTSHDFSPYGINRHLGIWERSSLDERFSFIRARHFNGGKEQEKKIDTIMRRIIKSKPEHVILDFTENPGGEIGRTSQLLSYFLPRSHLIARRVYRRGRRSFADKSFDYISKERKSFAERSLKQFKKARKRKGRYTLRVRRTSFGNPHYRGKLTVLVSPRTRSAAIIAALILKKERDATIVGFQDAGSIRTSCFAPHGHFALPVSGIKVAIADTCYERERQNRKQRGKLVPDIEVDPLAQPSDRLLNAIMERAVEHVLAESGTSASEKK